MAYNEDWYILKSKGVYSRLQSRSYDSYFAPSTKRKKALKVAIRCREFEISNYWKRTAYFWAFITVVYVAYYHVLVNVYSQKLEGKLIIGFGHIPTLGLAGLGLIFSIAWVLSSKGSKHWQENWEEHIACLEDPIMGPIHRIYKPNSFSVSKINLMLGYIVATYAFVLFVFEAVMFCKNVAATRNVNPWLLYLIILVLTIIGLLAFIKKAYGNVCRKLEGEDE